MNEAVTTTLTGLRQAYPDASVTVTEDGQGGAYVVVEPVDPGPLYKERETWIGFHLAPTYPYADVYPHYVRPDLKRLDGRPCVNAVTGIQLVEWRSHPALQLSRVSRQPDVRPDKALTKLERVLDWLAHHEGG